MTASISDFNDRQAPSELGCAACGARLAHDQRYCVQCGERRGPLPAHVAEALAARFEQGPELVRSPAPSAEQSRPRVAPRPAISWFPSTRVAAIAVLGMLAFGVAVGSAVGGGVTSLASAPLLILAQQSPPAVAPTSSAAGGDSSGSAGGSGSSGSQTAQTITVTSSAPQPQSPTASNTTTTSTTSTSSSNLLGLPPIKHVFLIVLSNHGYGQTFAPQSPDTYLSKTLAAHGEVVPDYYAVTPGPLANEIALISGQGPTPQTAANCPVFTSLVPGSIGQHGQALGAGCVYPPGAQTLADQLSTAGLRWKAYLQGLPSNAQNGCQLPKAGTPEVQLPTLADPYASWRNPFVYFQSLTVSGSCAKNEVQLSQLGLDLQTAKTTPAFSYIVADACTDGSDTQCAPATTSAPTSATTAAGPSTTTSSTTSASSTTTAASATTSTSGTTEPVGLSAADNFLKSVIPEIENSAAYQADGLIVITFDQAPQTGPFADPSSCCSNPTFPNLPSTTTGTATTNALGPASDPPANTTTSSTSTDTTSTLSTTPTTSTAPSSTTSTTTSITSTPASASATTTTGTTSNPTTTPPSTGNGESSPTGGGGQVGMLLLSRYVKPKTVNVTSYFNHFSLLKTVEAIFGLKYLGYAANIDTPVFDASVFNGGS